MDAEAEYRQEIAAIQAEAWVTLKRDMAAAKATQDSLRYDRTLLLMLLIKARLGKKLSQADLAAKLGMQQSTIARIESGRGNPGLNTLLAIAKALDVQLVLE